MEETTQRKLDQELEASFLHLKEGPSSFYQSCQWTKNYCGNSVNPRSYSRPN
jgi:hypothetical protein